MSASDAAHSSAKSFDFADPRNSTSGQGRGTHDAASSVAPTVGDGGAATPAGPDAPGRTASDDQPGAAAAAAAVPPVAQAARAAARHEADFWAALATLDGPGAPANAGSEGSRAKPASLSPLLENLNPEQRQAVAHVHGPLLVIAGAGSGKTRVITRRIAALIAQGIDARRILAVTFTNKAAGEMRERVAMLTDARGLTLGTFHSICARLLRAHGEAAGIDPGYTIFDSDDQRAAMRHVLKNLALDAAAYKPADVLRRISKAKTAGISPEDYGADALSYVDRGVARAYEAYQELLRENGALDFDDLLLLTVRLLRGNEAVREACRRRYRYVLVDEFQDTNGLQYDLTHLISAEHRNVCVTGDPDQSIYSWRGADRGNLISFERDYPEAITVTLAENYRSTKIILKAADALIAHNRNRTPKTMRTANPAGEPLRVCVLQDEESEALWIASTARRLCGADGLARPDEVAVFYRTNAQSRVIELAMLHCGVPYQVVRGVEFYQRREIKDLLAYLRCLVNPRDEVSLGRVVNTPARGIGATSLKRVGAFAAQRGIGLLAALREAPQVPALTPRARRAIAGFIRLIDTLQAQPASPVAPILRRVIAATEYEAHLARIDPLRAEDTKENVGELVNDAEKFDAAHPDATLVDYLENVALISDQDRLPDDADDPRVSLLTLHAAKGLEFPVVFLTGLEQGVLPHARVLEGDGDLEEERRLCYVGITRAKRQIYCTLAQQRTQAGRRAYNDASDFLRELPQELLQIETLAPSVSTTPIAPARAGAEVAFDTEVGLETQGRRRRAGARASGHAAPEPEPWEQPETTGKRPRVRAADRTQRTAVSPSALPARPDQFSVGDLVRHRKFGVGRIRELVGAGRNRKATVAFQGAGVKVLVLAFARLERVVL